MIELNPQVGQRLKALVSSPAMVPTAFFIRVDCADLVRNQLLAEAVKVHGTLGGQQILALFQCENLEVRPVSVLDTALELLATHKRLCGESNVAANPGPRASAEVNQVEGWK
jgi:phosphonate transport system substrate-binding protein